MSTPSGSGSRKRQKGAAGQAIEVSVAQEEDNTLGPVFALFPSVQPPSRTPFTLYSQTGEPSEDKTVLAAQTDQMEYDSRNHMGTELGHGDGQVAGEAAGHSTQYMIGVHNPRTNTLTLHSAPLHSLSVSITSLKSLPSAHTSEQMSIQRALLGTTFGTRKAIRNIRAQERNKLTVDSYGTASDTQSLLLASISASSLTLPTMAHIESVANAQRPIPPFNLDAKDPKEVYALDGCVAPDELAALDDVLGNVLGVKTIKERNAFLPYRRSTFLANQMRKILPNREDDAAPSLSAKELRKVRLLIHLSYLFAFRKAAMVGKDIDGVKLAERMGGPKSEVLDGLVERFTERMKVGGEERRKVTGPTELKLLSFLLVIVLRLDGWGTDVATIAEDLGLGTKKVEEMFKSLGCHVVSPGTAECQRLVASGAASTLNEAKKAKRAVLKVPLEFPKERRGAVKR